MPLDLDISYNTILHSQKLNTDIDEPTMIEYLNRIPPS